LCLVYKDDLTEEQNKEVATCYCPDVDDLRLLLHIINQFNANPVISLTPIDELVVESLRKEYDFRNAASLFDAAKKAVDAAKEKTV
jgi:hypothetical protein